MIHVILATGFEEIEVTTIVDVLRRCQIDVEMLSVTGTRSIQGAHGIGIIADGLLRRSAISESDAIILPGGMPGVKNLMASECLKKHLIKHLSQGKYVAAICAAPMILGEWGLADGMEVTCYPGFECYLKNSIIKDKAVVVNHPLITGNGPGAAMEFAFKIAEIFADKSLVNQVKKGMGVNI